MTIQVVSGGELRAVDEAVPQVTAGGSIATINVPFLPDLLRDKIGRRGRILDAEYVYRSQPAVRKVVDYLVKQFVQVPLHGYVRASASERLPLEPGDLQTLLLTPWPLTPPSRFLGELLRDRLLHDRWAVLPVKLADGSPALRRLPPNLWRPIVDGFDDVVGIMLGAGLRVERDQLVLWYGRSGGTDSPMEAIFTVLSELVEAARYREQMFRRTGRFPAVIQRPIEAAKWSDDAYNRFTEDFAERFSGEGQQAGELPVLEEGMTIAEVHAFSPADAQYLEGITLGEIQTCGFFHLAPELIGARAGNFSNMDAFRQGLYRETLGTYYTSFAEELTVQLVPVFDSDPRTYVEFLVEAALAGSFLEQGEAISRSVGGPWLLRSEARAMQNRPPIPGADKLIVPLNVVEGGLANPTDTAPQPRPGQPAKQLGRPADGAMKRPPFVAVVEDRLAGELATFFRGQGDDVLGQLRGQAKDAAPALEWDAERWDHDLAAVILHSTPLIAAESAQQVLERFDPSYDWSDDPMTYWLRAAAAGTARRTNANTRERILAAAVPPATKADGDWIDPISALFADDAVQNRGVALALAITTETSSFGGLEAAKAVGARQKRWRVHSANPRASHAALADVTVGLHETFANGLRWPGDHLGGPDETAGCTCSLEYVGG